MAQGTTIATNPSAGQHGHPLQYGCPVREAGHDEMVAGDGVLRPHWRDFVEALSALSQDELTARWERGRRLIRDNGITFHVHGDPQGTERPWQLDPIPVLLDGVEWRSLSAGLTQRARLLDAILADLYGPRTVLRDGLLPPALVFGHPYYLRPCHGLTPPEGIFLHLYAADLARAPDGGWQVVGDRTEAPAGAGYALENRKIVSRILAEQFRNCRVQWLAPYFQTLREMLLSLSPRRFEVPRLVLLTPGPGHETYFEHAYLARNLGCTLVESEDLTMRDGRVFLKTLDGLQPVDVILRHITGSLCDPLELDSRSILGVPGLAQAARAGAVAVANALGCGVLETPALAAYLPALCRKLLGEPLALPSAATWWCGDDRARHHVLTHLDRLVIRRTFDIRAPSIFGGRLGPVEREALKARIEARPVEYVAQEPLEPSTAPVWRDDGHLEPQPVILRAFLAANGTVQGGGYMAMPGGLMRASPLCDPAAVSLQSGEGGSKDTWVLSADGPPPLRPAQAVDAPVRLVRSGHDLPSRVADNMFWLGRYLERCEDLTRMLRALHAQAEDAANAGGPAEAVLILLAQLGLAPGRPGGKAGMTSLAQAAGTLGRMHFDAGYATGLRANADRLMRAATSVRDRLSLDTWRAVQHLHAHFATLNPAMAADHGEVLGRLDELVLMLEAASGLATENMTRGLGWRFLDIGRRIERASHMVDLLAGIPDMRSAGKVVVLDTLLMVSDSGMTYRSRYFSAPRFAPVLDLLLCDDTNPRSVAFQCAALSEHMAHLSRLRDTARVQPEQRLAIFLAGSVQTADIDILATPEEGGGLYQLGKLLAVLRSRLWELSETLTREYFTHAGRHAGARRENGRDMPRETSA